MFKTGFYALGLGACLSFAQATPLHLNHHNTVGYSFTIAASVNGVRRPFFLDTGAYITSLVSDEQTSTLIHIGDRGFQGTQSSPVTCAEVQVDDFGFDEFKLENPRGLRCALSVSQDNTLGVDWLDGRVLNFNFSKDDFSLSESTTALAFKLSRSSQGHILMPLEIAGSKLTAVFDTGCATTAVDASLIRANPNAFDPIESEVRVKDSANVEIPVHYYRVAEIKLGPLVLKDQIVMSIEFSRSMRTLMTGSDSPLVILGAYSIVGANWIIDLKTNTWSARLR